MYKTSIHDELYQVFVTAEYAQNSWHRVDAHNIECRLPADISSKYKKYFIRHAQKETLTLRQLQSLIGLLTFACAVVFPDRAFLRRFIDISLYNHPITFVL